MTILQNNNNIDSQTNKNVTNSKVKLISNIIISFVGAGILGLPFGFKEAGILGATLILSIVSLISTKSMLMIIKCKYIVAEKNFVYKPMDNEAEKFDFVIINDTKTKVMRNAHIISCGDVNNEKVEDLSYDLINYSDIGFEAFSHTGRLMVDLSVTLSQLGFCCAYFIFIAENVTHQFPLIKRWECIAFSMIFVYFLTLFRNLGKLGYCSLMAQFIQIIALCLVFWFDFENFDYSKIQIRLFSWSGLPFFFAFSIYCFEGAGMILALESSSSLTLRPNFKKYLIIVMILITMIYICFGVAGYASFGESTNPVITLNLSKIKMTTFANIIKFLLCFALLLTYPVMMFPVSQILDKKLKIIDSTWKGNLLRTGLVLLTVIIVLIVDKFEVLMGFVGATCCSLLAFILPGAFHLKLYSYRNSNLHSVFDILFIIFGAFVMIIGIIDAVARFYN